MKSTGVKSLCHFDIRPSVTWQLGQNVLEQTAWSNDKHLLGLFWLINLTNLGRYVAIFTVITQWSCKCPLVRISTQLSASWIRTPLPCHVDSHTDVPIPKRPYSWTSQYPHVLITSASTRLKWISLAALPVFPFSPFCDFRFPLHFPLR